MKAVFQTCLCAVFFLSAGAGEGAANDRQGGLYVNVADDADQVLAGLRKLARSGEWDKAAETAQKHIAAGGDKLFEIEPGLYVPFAEKVRRVVLAWPEAGVRAYRARYDAAADELYEQARRTRSARGLSEVARLYLPSSAGASALAALADIHVQRGELRAGMRALQRAFNLAPTKARRTKLESLRAALKKKVEVKAGPPFDIGLCQWSFEVPGADVDRTVAAGLRARGLRVPRLMRPVLSRGRVFVQTTQWVGALDRKTGEPLWRYPSRPNAPSARDCADAVLAPFVWADRVFGFVGGEVVALHAASGERAWHARSLVGEEAPRILVNSLAVADGRVFVCAAAVKQETESVALALDARTGAVLWRLELCSQVFRGVLGRGSHPAPPVFSEGTVYVSTNLGAVVAIDAEMGEARWLARYRSFSPARRCVALKHDDCWENGPPVVHGGLVIAAPQDSDHLIAFDTATGRQRWRAPRLGMRHLVGAADGRVYVSGSRAAAVDVETGKVAWLSEKLGDPVGRPALGECVLLVPTREAIFRLDVKTGKLVSKYRLDTPRERGNLVFAGDMLVSASFDRIDAYGRAAIQQGKASAEDVLRQGEWLERRGDIAGALKLYEEAMAARPDLRARARAAMYGARLRLGRGLAAAGRVADAERALVLARRFAPSPQAAEAAFAVAECRERMGKWKEAIAVYESVIESRLTGTVQVGGVSIPAGPAARARIERINEQHGNRQPPKRPDDARPKKLTQVWRTPFDTARSSPRVLASDVSSVLIVTRDKANQRTGLWDAVERRGIADGRLLWRTAVGKCSAKAHLMNDRLIVCGPNRLTALDLRTGRVLWIAPAVTDELAPRVIDSVAGAGKAFVATASREVFAVDAGAGREIWRKKFGEPLVARSLHFNAGRLVVCGENPGALYWLDPATGKEARKVRLDREDNRLTDTPAVQPQNNRLCLVLGDREVRNVRLDTGETLWKAEMPFGVGRVAATPDEKRILVFPDRWSFGEKAGCFEAASGKRLWTQLLAAKDPAGTYVGNDLVVSIRKKLLADVMVARRMTDGSVVWSTTLPVKPVINRITDADEVLIATGSRLNVDGPRGWAVVVRKKDGTVVAPLSRPGSAYSSVSGVRGALLLCSDRGIEAYRIVNEDAETARLAALLGSKEPPVADVVWRLAARGEYEAAMKRLDDALLAEPIEPREFTRLHEQLTAVREAARERRPTTYVVPLFRIPPKMDGRLCEDWRRDRAAVLDKPRHVENVQSARSPERFWAGPNDLSAVMYLGWDAENLYLAVDVSDDVQTVHDFDAKEWQGDCLLVGIDPEGNGGYRARGLDTVFWIGLTGKPKQPRDDRFGGEHNVRIKEDESGTIYELAIPWDEIGLGRPRAGMKLGLNIFVIDDDARGHLKAASWTPGLTQNRNKDIMTEGVAPALFGTLILKER